MKLLLCNADILVYNGDWSVIKNGYVGIDGDKIDYIGAEKPAGDYGRTKSLAGHLLMTGLYNMHTHTSMTLLRGIGSDLPLDRWLNEAVFPVEAKLTEADIIIGTRLALMEMLACGVCSFTDMYDFPHITADEVAAAGMKANLCRPVLSFDKNEAYADSSRVKESIEFFNNYNKAANGRIIVDFGIHAEYTSHETLVRAYGEDCKRHGAIMHLHLSETKKEHVECKERHGKTPAQWFYGLGVFENPTVAAHCVMAEPGDIDIIKENNVTAVHNPTSNMKLGSGFMPLQAMLESGINVAVGTDGAASNNNQNLLEEIHLASVLHNGYTQDPTIIKPEQLLTMATANGAKAQGRGDCGALAVGNKADLIAINMDAPHLMPAFNIPALLTYSAQAADVVMTMVDGKILYENGEYLTIDRERIKSDLEKSLARLY